MNWNPVILSIPVFFMLIGIELVYEVMTRKKTYRLNDAITNINLGVLDQVTGVFFKVVKIGIYTVVYQHFAFTSIEPTWGAFAVLFVLYDLCYYWSHRMAHEISLFWGGHVVHHQSEAYNLSVALRQSSTSFLWSFPFYLPLALMGFSPVQVVFVGGFNLLYQFWIHTEHINRLPKWFEGIMNTPSHHRVHHARDPKYIDKNYAGVFIIWDKLFGTFKQEEERPTYGITKPLNSWNPVYANISHYIDLWQTVKKTTTFQDKLKVLFNKPGWQPDYLGGYQAPKAPPLNYQKYNADIPLFYQKIYVFIQFLVAITVTAVFLFGFKDLTPVSIVLLSTWIVFSTLILGYYFELSPKRLLFLDSIRLLAFPIGLFILQQTGVKVTSIVWIGSTVFALLSLTAAYFLFKNKNNTKE